MIFSRGTIWGVVGPVWVMLMLSCLTSVSGAAIGSTSRIPVPGSPDIIVTTFLSPRLTNSSTTSNAAVVAAAAAPVSISNAACTTTCSGTPFTGPNQNDCTTIANSLRSNGGTTVTLTPFLTTQFAFRSCKILVSNQSATQSIVSTQRSIATVAQNLAGRCNAVNGNAAGGTCAYTVGAQISVGHS
ncbi:hypothetical protein BDV93DRAFT_262762 [Ceratobasidium sp. AG-I]|nr:hypothetical protein BDV93DRAFT_262762 [Ceratobasidium sp. AG-I]